MGRSELICFWCGEVKGHVPGKDMKFISYDPCNKCSAVMCTGVTVFEAGFEPASPGQPPIYVQQGKGVYPLGRWLVTDRGVLRRLKLPDNFDMIAVPTECMDKLVQLNKQGGKVNENQCDQTATGGPEGTVPEGQGEH